jgi:hypothetical protein
MGHEDAFPRPRLSARCWFSQGTFAGTWGNGRDAPIPDFPTLTPEREVRPFPDGRLGGDPYTADFFQNPAGPANKQPYAAVIAGTAAAQPPSIAAGSIGSRSRSKQRS